MEAQKNLKPLPVHYIKGQQREIFCLRFCSSIAPDQPPKVFSNLVSNLLSYLNLNLTFCCIIQQGVKSCRCMMLKN